MIESFRDRWLEEYFVNDIRGKRIPAVLADRLFRKLQLIEDAKADADLRTPPSNHFEKLEGKTRRLSFDTSQSTVAIDLHVG